MVTKPLQRVADRVVAFLLIMLGVLMLYCVFIPQVSRLARAYGDKTIPKAGALILQVPNRFDSSILPAGYLQGNSIEIDVVTRLPNIYRMQITGRSDGHCGLQAMLKVDDAPSRPVSVSTDVQDGERIRITADIELDEKQHHLEVIFRGDAKCGKRKFSGVSFEQLSSAGKDF